MQTIWNFGAVFIGGGIGSLLRDGVGRVSITFVGPDYPAGTLVVNLVGCFLMGLLAGWLSHRDLGVGHSTRLFLATGILGGFTTFSAFALDAVTLWERGDTLSATIYALASIIGSLAGFVLGLHLARAYAS